MKPEQEACEKLKNGGVIVHATEAVFGLAATIYDYQAFERISYLKERPPDKKFIVLFADLNSVSKAVKLDVGWKKEILAGWPGPNTWVLPARGSVPFWIKDMDGCVAVRVTAHSQCREIIDNIGPVLSTSANRSGINAPKTLHDAKINFGNRVDFYLPGDLGGMETVTTIRNGLTGKTIRK